MSSFERHDVVAAARDLSLAKNFFQSQLRASWLDYAHLSDDSVALAAHDRILYRQEAAAVFSSRRYGGDARWPHSIGGGSHFSRAAGRRGAGWNRLLGVSSGVL